MPIQSVLDYLLLLPTLLLNLIEINYYYYTILNERHEATHSVQDQSQTMQTVAQSESNLCKSDA